MCVIRLYNSSCRMWIVHLGDQLLATQRHLTKLLSSCYIHTALVSDVYVEQKIEEVVGRHVDIAYGSVR